MKWITVRNPEGYVQSAVDDEDYPYLYQWCWNLAGGKGSKGKYAARQVRVDSRPTTVYMHREVAVRAGIIPSALDGITRGCWVGSIDHIDGDKLNNQRANLRLLNRSQQMLNVDGLRSTNTSGYRGVSYSDRPGRIKKWRATVTKNRVQKTIGWYATYEEAVEARIRWDEAQAASSS